MQNRKSKLRVSPAMIVACLALFVALGSGAYAAIKLAPNSVKAKNLKAGAVTNPKIKDNAVSEAKIAASAVTENKLAPNAVSAGKLASASVTKGKFVASGTAQNTTTYTLNNTCTLDTTFAAPGVQPGDTIAYSFEVTVPAGVLSAAPGEGTAGNGTIAVEVCENAGVAANVTPGSMKLHWIAVR